MWRTNWRLAGTLLLAAVAVGMVGLVCAAGDCYEDITITGGFTGDTAVYNNVSIPFDAMQNGRPAFDLPGDIWCYWDGGMWVLETPTFAYGNFSNTPTPPSSDWWHSDGIAFGEPLLSGGEECSASIVVSAISGATTEAGGTATFTLTPDPAPTADVTVPLSSSNTGEGTVQTEVVLPAGSTAPVTVTVTGVDDDIDDGDIAYTIVTGDPVSQGDAGYEALGADDVDDVSVTNTDDDTKGVTVTPTSGLTTTEAGGTATFTVVLDSEPALGDCGETPAVIILVQSDDTTEGTVSPSTLIFMYNQWNVPKTVTITGADDDISDGDVGYTIVVQPAMSCGYDGVDGADVSVTNQDDDVPGITVSAISGNTVEDGTEATFTVVLNSEPVDSVTIDLLSDDLSEGTIDLGTLTFTTGNWDQRQVVTVTGVDDAEVDGDIEFTIEIAPAVSGDNDYSGIDPDDVAVINEDDDTADDGASPLVIIPTVEAGPELLLDIVLPVVEGEEPLMAGERVLTAIHVVGEMVTGSCQILGATGVPTCIAPVRVFLYSVDITTRPETIVFLSHAMADYNWDTLEYDFAVDTTGMEPGYYDLHLLFKDGSAEIFRIQLVAPEN